MSIPFTYRSGELHCDRVALTSLAERHGTPLYVYSATEIEARFRVFDRAFHALPHTICYSVKANSNLSLLRLLARLGAGFDVVSGGELERVLRAHKPAARKAVFSGVGKTAEEMDMALRAGILIFNVESESEIDVLAARASRLKKRARIALRVNPDVSAETHPYISTGLREHKFGIPIDEAERLYAAAAGHPSLDIAGVSVHIGSQITSPAPFRAAMQRVATLVRRLRSTGHNIRYVDAGGGLGINYEHNHVAQQPTAVRLDAKRRSGSKSPLTDLDFPARARAYADAVVTPLRKLNAHLLLEPGRSIVGPAGALVARVLYVKRNGQKRFVVLDAAMNDLIRPSLYGAYHEIVPVRADRSHSDIPSAASRGEARARNPYPIANVSAATSPFDVVGPICETGDFFARDRELPPLAEGDLVAILDAGAYGMSISSNYNTRCRAAEVLVSGSSAKLARRRETYADLLRAEDV
jgi:diaminopimelate decarboxylase